MSERRRACVAAWHAWQDSHGFPHSRPDDRFVRGWNAATERAAKIAEAWQRKIGTRECSCDVYADYIVEEIREGAGAE